MNLKEKRAAALKAAKDIVDGAKAAGADLTDEQAADLEGHVAEVKSLDVQIAAAMKSAQLMGELDAMVPQDGAAPTDRDDAPAKSLGEHFVKHAGERLAEIKGRAGASVAAPEYKAATDNHTGVGWTAGVPVLTDYDRTVIAAYRPRLVVADLLGKGSISGNAISYFVEGAREGNFTTVAEAGAKPQLHYVNPTAVVDALKKIAGFIKLTDEFIEDIPFLVSEINNRLLYDLGSFEEAQLLAGAGTGSTIQGLLNRSGIQTETAADNTDNADAVFRAITKIAGATDLSADGIVINPADYQKFRLSKDANGQYFGGGFFAGQYGQGGIPENPPLWGLRTVVTPAITAGTVLVGAYSSAATVYRKGGLRVESTNSHSDDFTNNLVTIRAEERIALAVRKPLGFVKVTTSAADPE